jgi:hypothetical protein
VTRVAAADRTEFPVGRQVDGHHGDDLTAFETVGGFLPPAVQRSRRSDLSCHVTSRSGLTVTPRAGEVAY